VIALRVGRAELQKNKNIYFHDLVHIIVSIFLKSCFIFQKSRDRKIFYLKFDIWNFFLIQKGVKSRTFIFFIKLL
jgi:hypothetical protein